MYCDKVKHKVMLSYGGKCLQVHCEHKDCEKRVDFKLVEKVEELTK